MDLMEGILWLALNIYFEARNQPLQGQYAVAHVTINRAARTGKSIKAVVLEPGQFSWVRQNKAGQAIMEVRYLLPRYYAVDTKTIKSIQRRQDEGNKPCSKKQAAVKAFLKKARLQLAV